MRKAKLAVLILGAALAVSACGGKDKGKETIATESQQETVATEATEPTTLAPATDEEKAELERGHGASLQRGKGGLGRIER